MQDYWMKFSDGSKGYCEGQSTYEAVRIAEHLTGKKVEAGPNQYQPKLDTLPYPATPIIWQFTAPGSPVCPAFCYKPDQCKGSGCCPQNYSCTE